MYDVSSTIHRGQHVLKAPESGTGTYTDSPFRFEPLFLMLDYSRLLELEIGVR